MSSKDENFKLYKSFGSLIKDYRKFHKMNQETFAELIGVSIREVRRWEADYRRARFDNLHDVSEITGIPMQVCIALNSDQPLWYSLQERRFAYSLMETKISAHELFKYFKQLNDEKLLSMEHISTDKHIHNILSCHRWINGTDEYLQSNVIEIASSILPDLNHIIFDSWGHYVGHNICLPLSMDVYQQLKKQRRIEDYLTTERLSNISSFHEGVFFYYSVFANSFNVGLQIAASANLYFAKIAQKKRYLVAVYTTLKKEKESLNKFGMRLAHTYGGESPKVFPKLYEMELDVLIRPFGPLGLMVNESIRKAGNEGLIREAKQEGLPAILAQEPNNVSRPYKKYSMGRESNHGPLIDCGPLIDGNIKSKLCLNPKCILYDKIGKGNIIFNGTYRTKEGVQVRRFFCKVCKNVFCSRAGSIFYDLRTPEEKILMAFKLLVKGMTLRGVAKTLRIKRDTIRNWLKVAAERSEEINAMLIKDPDMTKVEIDALWTFVKSNSLRQRANCWKRRA